jgi:acrylyl-CoA reductase (NADPH)
MAIGTAGYTAARSVMALEEAGVTPDSGPVLVTGAGGGVGSVAVDVLAGRGYEVVASSGKDPDFLRSLGAADVISREDAAGDAGRPLEKTRWAAAVDAVGGATLAGVLRSMRYGGVVAASGNAGGIKLESTVLPFILRAVRLLGIDSVQTPIDVRRSTWERLAGDLRPRHLDGARAIGLDELEPALDAILRGELQGRTVVRI